MAIHVTGGALGDVAADIHVVMIAPGVTKPAGDAAAADRATGGAISKLLAGKLFTGRTSDVVVLPVTGRGKAKRVVAAGLGDPAKRTVDIMRTQMGNLSRRLRDIGGGTVAISIDALDGIEPEQAGELIA